MGRDSERPPRREKPYPENCPRVEREFGVPIPGQILDPELWARTAIKKLPVEKPLDWEAIFGRRAPIVLDLGCGNGRFTLASGITRPHVDHLAVDILPVVIRYATRRGNQRGLSNVRFAVIGGSELLREYIPPGSVSEIHCYHPQPYYDQKEIHKRLVTPAFLALAHQALIPGGLLVLQTDHPAYWRYTLGIVSKFFAFCEHPGRWPEAPRGRTRREILAMKKGITVYRGEGRRRDELSPDEVSQMAEMLPLPTFKADRARDPLAKWE